MTSEKLAEAYEAEYMEANEYANAAYFDIQVVIRADNKVLGTISKTEEALTFMFAIPEELKLEGRKFIVLRIHNGEITELDISEIDGHYAIETDAFSTYAVVYKQEKAPEMLLGDVNGDEMVNARDALLILQNAASIVDLNEQQELVADMNQDGMINAMDALAVLRKAAGLD